ncbi:hypothetical protein EW026_g5831 [Hermanssonia centrifuga]|uniref:Uncharacterized protein n=1 Tax=Hermanssonia centrifuga TaxID=98765 RepID=A0A4S4KDX2_9APHY|nr:hypothetical protein EW026_g5831 [Hermanssonia centrifuga]
MWWTPAGAKAMKYRAECTKKMMETIELTANGQTLNIPDYANYIHGLEYIDAVTRGDIQIFYSVFGMAQ